MTATTLTELVDALSDLDIAALRDEEAKLERALAVARGARQGLEALEPPERPTALERALEVDALEAMRVRLEEAERRAATSAHLLGRPAAAVEDDDEGERLEQEDDHLADEQRDADEQEDDVRPDEEDAPAVSDEGPPPAPGASSQPEAPAAEPATEPSTSPTTPLRDALLDELRRRDDWTTPRDLAAAIGVDAPSLRRPLRRLVEERFVDFTGSTSSRRYRAYRNLPAGVDDQAPDEQPALSTHDQVVADQVERGESTMDTEDAAHDRLADRTEQAASARQRLIDSGVLKPGPNSPPEPPPISGRLRRTLAAEERERQRLSGAGAAVTSGRDGATLEGRVFAALEAQPDTLTRLATRLRLGDSDREKLARVVTLMYQRGELVRSRPLGAAANVYAVAP